MLNVALVLAQIVNTAHNVLVIRTPRGEDLHWLDALEGIEENEVNYHVRVVCPLGAALQTDVNAAIRGRRSTGVSSRENGQVINTFRILQ